MNKAVVREFIKKKATPHIKTRALDIYSSNAIKFIKVDNINGNAYYKVKGSKVYDVVIFDYSSKNLHIECSCPYDWTDLCKHGLASLYHLDKQVSRETLLKTVTRASNLISRIPSEKIELFNAEIIKEYFFDNYHFSKNFGHSYFDFLAKELIGNIFKIEAYSGRKLFAVITIEKDDEKLFISSSASGVSKPYTKPHLYNVEYKFLNFLKKYNPSFLENIFNEELKIKIQTKIARNFGLEKKKDLSKYFDIFPDLIANFNVNLKEQYRGLIPLKKSERKEKFDDFLKEISIKKNLKSIISLKKDSKKEFYLGFLISKTNQNRGTTFVNVTVLKGKLQKNKGTLIGVKEYEEYYENECKITSSQRKMLNKIAEFNSLVDGINSEELDIYFSKLKEIFAFLKNEKFVFHYKNSNGFDSYYNKLRKSDMEEAKISKNYIVDVRFKIEKNGDLIEAKPIFFNKNIDLDLTKNKVDITGFGVFHIDNYLFVANSKTSYNFYNNFKDYSLSMMQEYEEEFIEKYVLPMSQKWDIEFSDDLKYTIEKEYLEPEKKQIFIEEEEDYFIIIPQVKYLGDIETKLDDKQDIYKQENFKITQYVRDNTYEEFYLEFLASLHKDFEAQQDEGIFYIHIDNVMEDMWFFQFFDHLEKEKVEVFGLKELKNFKYSPHKAKVQTSISSGTDWFDVDVNVSFGNQNISLKDIKKAIVNKDKFVKLGDDSVGILPEEWLEKMESYFRHGEISDGQLKVSKMKFSIIDELFEGIDQEEILKEIYEKKQLLKEFKKIDKIKIPKEITATLRDYQKEGLNWLHFLKKMKWGGLLADDMGLGKTIQVITLLQSVQGQSKLANLIILPTSLMFNWEKELEKFAPKLIPFFYYGTNRVKEESIFKENDLIITTYGVMTKDIEFLSSQSFNYIIIDESQAIKNPNSQRYKAAMLLKAKNKIALTGTPIENNTFDLYAQMNFVNPGFFGSMKSFRDNYALPIDKDGDVEMAEELQKLITPFLLRRTKEQVATELPPKTEDIIYCEMPPKQQKIYDAYKNEYRNKIMNKIEEDGLNKSKLFVLAALTKLRQICDSPLLLKDKHIDTNDSAKIKLLLEHINEKTANHKILIFSQFTSMLALIRAELEKEDVLFEYLDGKSTPKQRQKSVENFQNDTKIRVFLISLKAGGTGLNLTEADYVYIVDPWWNPAVENQAIDRCYRIGQDKSVMAYRLICKGTIEEKIIKLQNKKKKLASDIIQTDEKIMKTIDKSSLMDLFS